MRLAAAPVCASVAVGDITPLEAETPELEPETEALADGRALAPVAAEMEALGEAFGVALIAGVKLGETLAFGVIEALGLMVALGLIVALGLALNEAVAVPACTLDGISTIAALIKPAPQTLDSLV